MSNYRRHGDVNLHPITQEHYLALSGEVKKHAGHFIIARGEATGSTHEVHVADINNLEVKELQSGRLALAIRNEAATVTHTHDHETIELPAQTYYVQVPEREIDWFAEGVTRNVID